MEKISDYQLISTIESGEWWLSQNTLPFNHFVSLGLLIYEKCVNGVKHLINCVCYHCNFDSPKHNRLAHVILFQELPGLLVELIVDKWREGFRCLPPPPPPIVYNFWSLFFSCFAHNRLPCVQWSKHWQTVELFIVINYIANSFLPPLNQSIV